MITKHKKYIVYIILCLLLIYSVSASADSLKVWMIDEMLRINEKKVSNSRILDAPRDCMTRDQAISYVSSVFYYSEKLNNKCEKVHPRRVAKDIILGITPVETWYVNYESLDNGRSFGRISMQWTTAKWLATEVYNWDWQKEKNQMLQGGAGDKLQGKYIVGYYYWLLNKYDGNRKKALLGYNKHHVNNKQRWERYFFLVYGKLKYYDDEVFPLKP